MSKDISAKLNNFFRSSESPKANTLVFCLPVPELDACVLCDSHGYSELSPTEIINSDWFLGRYQQTYTWECWGETEHSWNLEGYQSFENPEQSLSSVLVLYYSPSNPAFIEQWMGCDKEEAIASNY